jgi:phosphomannomutase / phosphoglucomutase
MYRCWGQSLGAKLEPGSAFVVGGDVRVTTPAFLDALIDGLLSQDMRVLTLGVCPTPMVYFHRRQQAAAGCAIVTASHSPADHNGLKFMLGDDAPAEEDVLALRAAAEGAAPTPRGQGTVETLEFEPYASWLEDRWRDDQPRDGFYAILDPGNGCWGRLCVPLLRRVFPPVMLSVINEEPDGTFPDRSPDCARPEHLKVLCERVVGHGADLGIAFDGDGDRVAFVDASGSVLSAEEAAWILARGFGAAFRDRAFVYDLKCTDRLAEGVAQLGGIPLAERSGHAFIRRRMREENALFGAEISGHFFYDELDGGDDGLFTACRMISLLARERRGLAALRDMPPVHMTPDIRLAVDDRDAFLSRVRESFADFDLSFVDGVRVDFPGGWLLARSSVTEPRITLRFEGDTAKDLSEVIYCFTDAFPEHEAAVHGAIDSP